MRSLRNGHYYYYYYYSPLFMAVLANTEIKDVPFVGGTMYVKVP